MKFFKIGDTVYYLETERLGNADYTFKVEIREGVIISRGFFRSSVQDIKGDIQIIQNKHLHPLKYDLRKAIRDPLTCPECVAY